MEKFTEPPITNAENDAVVDKKTPEEVPEVASDKKDLRDFSKRYALSARQNLADEIRELRFRHAKKESGNEDRVASIETHKTEVETLQETQNQLELELASLNQEIEEHKGRLISKIKDFFKKEQLDQELEIDVKNKSLAQVKGDISNRLKLIAGIEEVVEDASDLGLARQKAFSFYQEQGGLKAQFESEQADRDVEKLSKDKGYIFFHSLLLNPTRDNATGLSVPFAKINDFASDVSIPMILGLEPTLSTTAIKYGETRLKPFNISGFGLILGGGNVLAANESDAQTSGSDLYNRKGAMDDLMNGSSIQDNIKNKIESAVDIEKHPTHKYGHARGEGAYNYYNELIVEKPKVAGIFIQESLSNKNIVQVIKCSQKYNLPIFYYNEGKLYQFDLDDCFEKGYGVYVDERKKDVKAEGEVPPLVELKKSLKNESGEKKINLFYAEQVLFVGYQQVKENLKEVSIEDVVFNARDLDVEEKKHYATTVVEKNPFRLEKTSEDFKYFKSYAEGSTLDGGTTMGIKGYDLWQKSRDNYARLLEKGIKGNDPGTLESILKNIEDTFNSDKQYMSGPNRAYMLTRNQQLIYGVYGFAVGALKAGDNETYKLMENIVVKYGGSFEECKKMIDDRTDEKGEFKVKNSDMPLSVRQKMSELEKAA